MNILLTVSYVGTLFCGFQIQPNKRTVQGDLESALCQLYGAEIRVIGSGRTDEGVHAISQAVNFLAPANIPLPNVVKGLNCFLPKDIRVTSAVDVSDDFHARINAHKKTYAYKFYFANNDDPFLQDRAMRLDPKIDIVAMQSAAKLFEGAHDFNAFRCYGSSAKTTVRTVYDCNITTQKASSNLGLEAQAYDTATLIVAANGFLYKMVRLIVGALIKVGSGKLTNQDIIAMLNSGAFDPKKIPAPSSGLYLLNVTY